jgi:hypothetical protein
VSQALRLGLATIVTVASALALAFVSAAPFRVNALPDARLRVAFSARPERIETCRIPSADELAKLPTHMRQGVVCEGITASYRLEVRRDDSLVAGALLRGGGLRHDRQIYALRELSVPSGRSTIDVRLERLDTVAARPGGAQHESDEHRRRVADEVPPMLTLHEDVTLDPREVLLVTYDQASRRLRIVRGSR